MVHEGHTDELAGQAEAIGQGAVGRRRRRIAARVVVHEDHPGCGFAHDRGEHVPRQHLDRADPALGQAALGDHPVLHVERQGQKDLVLEDGEAWGQASVDVFGAAERRRALGRLPAETRGEGQRGFEPRRLGRPYTRHRRQLGPPGAGHASQRRERRDQLARRGQDAASPGAGAEDHGDELDVAEGVGAELEQALAGAFERAKRRLAVGHGLGLRTNRACPTAQDPSTPSVRIPDPSGPPNGWRPAGRTELWASYGHRAEQLALRRSFGKARADLGDLDAASDVGEFGGRCALDELREPICGAPPGAAALVGYLEASYGGDTP